CRQRRDHGAGRLLAARRPDADLHRAGPRAAVCRHPDRAPGGAAQRLIVGGPGPWLAGCRRRPRRLRIASSPFRSPTMSRIIHRTLNKRFPVAVGGEGVWIVDAEGNRYIDASGGAAVSCLGHGHPDINAAMHAQIDRLAYAHTSFFTTEVAEDLAETLVAEDRKSDV